MTAKPLQKEPIAIRQPVRPVEHGEPDSVLSWCYRHPGLETGLRCNRCNRPICPRCARQTPVGYRCPACIEQQQAVFYTGTRLDYLAALVVAAPLCLATVTVLVVLFHLADFYSLFVTILGAQPAGNLIAGAVRWITRARRGRHLARLVNSCLVLASLPAIALFLFEGLIAGLIGAGILLVAAGRVINIRLS